MMSSLVFLASWDRWNHRCCEGDSDTRARGPFEEECRYPFGDPKKAAVLKSNIIPLHDISYNKILVGDGAYCPFYLICD